MSFLFPQKLFLSKGAKGRVIPIQDFIGLKNRMNYLNLHIKIKVEREKSKRMGGIIERKK